MQNPTDTQPKPNLKQIERAVRDSRKIVSNLLRDQRPLLPRTKYRKPANPTSPTER